MDETKDRRVYIADLETRTSIAWKFHNMYPEIDIDFILDGIKKETDILHGVVADVIKVIAEIPAEPEPEPEPDPIEVAKELAEKAKQEEIAALKAKLVELNKK